MNEAAKTRTVARQLWLAAIAVIGCTVAVTSFAASPVVCDQSASFSRNANLDLDGLSIDAVEHYSSETVVTDAPETADLDTASLSPLLSLSPRIASMLDQVFASPAGETTVTEVTASAPAPIADSFTGHPGITNDNEGASSAEETVDDDFDASRIRERMFRKDI